MGIICWMLDDITVYPETHHVTFRDLTGRVSVGLKPANSQIRLNRKVKLSHLRVVVEKLFICKIKEDLWLYVLTLFPTAIRVFHS